MSLEKNEAWMRDRYLKKKKSPAEIAKEAKCSQRQVYIWLEKFGLIRK